MIIRFKPVIFRLVFSLMLLFALTNVNAAKIYFNDVFKGTGSSYAEQTNSISSIQFITGTGFTFTSTDPADVTFRLTGNNVAGTLSYINSSGVSQSIIGQVSRQDKSGNTTEGLYFYTTTNEAYLLVIPGVTTYSANTNVSTSSDPILAVMNDVLTAQNSQPKITINNVTVNNTDPYAVFTISLSTAANANISFTPSLTASTATLNTDYTNSMQYYNGSTWVNITTTVSIAQGGTSIQIRIPILNGGGTSNRTFNLVTGSITGGNILNSDGSYGVGTILPSPNITTTGTLKTFSTCSGCTINPQKFTVSGSNLTSNVTVTAPTGFVMSLTATGTYVTSFTFTPTSGTLNSTEVFTKLQNTATSGTNGIFTVASTGAVSKTITATVNTDNALNFDGGNDIISTASNISALNITGDITVETWIRLNQMPSDYVRLIGKGASLSERTYGLWLYSDGSLLWQQHEGNLKNLITNSSVIPVGEWTHIAVARIGSNVKIYINGNEIIPSSSSSFSGTPNSSTAPLEIGGASNVHVLLNGSMDEVRIWNVGRTSSQISGSYLTELAGDGNSNETGLVAYYNFNQGIAGGSNASISVIEDRTSNVISGTLTNFAKTGSSSNFVAGFIPSITGTSTAYVGASATLSNSLTGGTWSSTNTAVATVNSTTGAITGVAAGTSTISYTICDKTVNTLFTVTAPTITTTGTLTAFSTCATTNSAAQTFTVSAQSLTANLVLTAPTGYEIATSSGGTYSSTISITPSSGTVSARLIYVRTTTSAVNGQSGNIVITSTDATTKNVVTGNAVITQNKTASLTISSNATNNTICSGSSITFTANATNGGSTPTYQWQLNGSNISGAIGSTYTTSSISSNATITAVMTSNIASCLSGSPATSNAINVIVNSVPNNPGAISGLTTICMNSNQVFSIPAVSGATSYTWVVTGSLSASVSSTTNVINITAANAAGSGTITVFANNACGTSINSSTLTVAVNNTPAPTASFTTSANNVCLSSAGITFTNTSTPNATTSATISSFVWDYADGNTYSSTSSASVSHTYTSTGNFDAILKIQDANNCTSSISSRIIVDPISIAGTASVLNTTICEQTSTTLNLTGSTGTIQWQSSSDGINYTNIVNATSATYITPNLTSTTYFKAVVKSGSCSIATSGVVTVTVSPKPSATLTNVTGLSNSATSFDLVYTSVVGNPNEYSISSASPNAMPSFNAVNNFGLLGSPILVNIPASASGIYNFNLILNNNILGCASSVIPFTVSIAIAPPAGLTYTSPNVYTVGTAIGTLTPTSTGGTIASYAVSPSLPAGLTINSTTGLITGTPSAGSTQTSYVVTGTNGSGTVTATVVMTVNIAPPAGLTYTSPNVYKVGTAIGTLTPTSTGGTIASYSVSPSLPAGLNINATTGVITGTPSAVSTQTSYVVTGTNGSGTVTATVVMTVNIAPPAGLTYTSPNVYTVGTAIGTLTPTSTGGTIASYAVSPSLPAGLTINASTGLINGTPSAVSTQTSYVVTGTNPSGTVTATVVMTVNSNTTPQPQQPQGALNAVDFKLLAKDTVTLKLTISNGTAPFTLILNNTYNTSKDTIRNLTPFNGDVIFKLKQLDSTKIYTIFKLIDANDNMRTSGFTKDTTKVNVLKPKIVLTLKADPTVKQADNSFKTKLLLKIKNAGDLDLRNVQVNANLSTVFPQGINYKLDSVRVLSGNLSINPNYNGAGSATAVSSIYNPITVSKSVNKNTYSVLDQNLLFSNGVSLNKSEEGEVVYYVSIGATTQNVTIKLQFETAGAGILTKTDGSSSSQETKSKSDDGTNINQHPDITKDGLPLPTYVPLVPNEKIGASLSVSASKPVTGGYEFHFIAKIKNFGNINLDSIRIEYDLTKMFPRPDQAELVSNPIIKRGNIVYNTTNYNGSTDIDLFKYGGNLQVGDSAIYEYDLKVTTSRTSFTWPNYFIVFARSINTGLVIHDTSMAGLNPDPNNDNDPIEKFFTSVTINYKAPSPPIVENKTYVYGTSIPANIGGLVKSTPTGTVPVWCNEKTAACSLLPPSTPIAIGRYIFALRSYDTATLLYSDVIVFDTVIIKPPVPTVLNKKYIIGISTNPSNIVSQVTGLAGSILKYFKNAIVQSTIPVLGTTTGIVRYTASQIVNEIESDTVGFTVEMLEPKNLIHVQKIASEPRLISNSSFNIVYTFIVTNRTSALMTNVAVSDNLLNTFPSPTTFEVGTVTTTGGLVSNVSFNGKTDIQLLKSTSQLASNAVDTIKLTLNLQPKGYNGVVNNIATITATTPNGTFSLNSSSTGFVNEKTKTPTPLTIPDLVIDIPEAFSPNRDGVNDRFVILKPFGTTLELEVFNRWGNVVYYNANYNNDWDGRGTNNFIGQDLIDGGYYYTLKTKSANGNSQIFKGFVIIQR